MTSKTVPESTDMASKCGEFACEGEGDEVDAAAAIEETPITPATAGTQSAAVSRRKIARRAIQKARGPLSTKPQDLQVRFRRVVYIRLIFN